MCPPSGLIMSTINVFSYFNPLFLLLSVVDTRTDVFRLYFSGMFLIIEDFFPFTFTYLILSLQGVMNFWLLLFLFLLSPASSHFSSTVTSQYRQNSGQRTEEFCPCGTEDFLQDITSCMCPHPFTFLLWYISHLLNPRMQQSPLNISLNFFKIKEENQKKYSMSNKSLFEYLTVLLFWNITSLKQIFFEQIEFQPISHSQSSWGKSLCTHMFGYGAQNSIQYSDDFKQISQCVRH